MEKVFKDVASQAVDIVFEQFKELIHVPHATLSWIDKECGLADINSGLIFISYADMLIAVRQRIPLEELRDWSDYNTRLCNVGLENFVTPLEKWMSFDTKKVDNITLSKLEDAHNTMVRGKNLYEQMIAEITQNLITHN